MENIRVGLIGEAISTVTSDKTAKHLGSGVLNIFSTPSMVAIMEEAAVNAVDPHLSNGHASVGIALDIQHVSATPMGELITSMAEITAVEGKRITLEVRAWDENTLIGAGKHQRYVINIEEFMKRFEN